MSERFRITEKRIDIPKDRFDPEKYKEVSKEYNNKVSYIMAEADAYPWKRIPPQKAEALSLQLEKVEKFFMRAFEVDCSQ
jgi:hypothetical protein